MQKTNPKSPKPAATDRIVKAGNAIAREMAAAHPGLGLTFGVQVSFELDNLQPGESAPAVTVMATRTPVRSGLIYQDKERIGRQVRRPIPSPVS